MAEIKTAKMRSKTKDLVLSALLISLVFVATEINFRLPISINGGLIHLGNTMLFMSAIVFGKRKGAVAGAFGMGLFDILSGWVAWAPFTFIIRGIMGYIIGYVSNSNDRKGNSTTWNLIGIVISGIIMIAGYYIAEIIITGNYIAPITSIPGNIIQIVFGALFGLPIVKALKKTNMF